MRQETVPNQIILLHFAVKSSNPNVDTAMILDQISESQPELETVLDKYVPTPQISMKRRGNLPIGLETAVVAILITVGKDVAQAVLKKAAEDAYGWLKTKWQNAHFEKLPASRKSPPARPRKTKARSVK